MNDLVTGLRLPPGIDAVLGLDLPAGAQYGAGQVVLVDGVKMLQVPLWRSYLAGCILLGIAPCTAMVLVWGYLARGNDGHTLVMVAINSLTMLVLYGALFTWAIVAIAMVKLWHFQVQSHTATQKELLRIQHQLDDRAGPSA